MEEIKRISREDIMLLSNFFRLTWKRMPWIFWVAHKKRTKSVGGNYSKASFHLIKG